MKGNLDGGDRAERAGNTPFNQALLSNCRDEWAVGFLTPLYSTAPQILEEPPGHRL